MAWELIVNKSMNQSYRGPAELCDYRFSLWPEQFPGVTWTAQQIVNAHINSLAGENSQLLELRMWEDASPTWTTDYYVEIIATASPIIWTIIIAGVLAILIITGTFFIIDKVEDIVEYIGEVSPATLPLMALGAIGLITVIGIYLVRR